ncbi:MAG: AgmX/PglI C-terminal domain-containing protein [Deltaproteobacteria bacterium]|nr:AgmX/PglI C-terminal domain-containing protein [Deltaproteobacteria bacterium]
MRSVLLLAVVFACGGHKSEPQEPRGESVLGVQDTGDPNDHSGNMVPPEKMDEIQNDLKRKQMIISHCLAEAVERGDAKKNTHGKVTVELTVSTGGHAEGVKVIKSDFQAASIGDCVKKHVEEIAFPQIPKQYPTSYTYAMEAD